MLICPSDIFSNTNVMLLEEVFTLKRCFLLSLSPLLSKKSLEINLLFKLQSPILYIKKKNMSIRHNNIITLMKSGTTIFPFWCNVHDLSWCEVFFSSLSQYLLGETCCKNYADNDGTFLRKEVKLLSVRHNL